MTPLDRHHAHQLLEQMIRIRRFEEKSAELYSAGKIRGFLHLYIGEEAVSVGVQQSIQPQDSVLATYREHGHALMAGLSAGSIMAEMYGKQEGCSRGRGGSMHLFSAEHRFYGGNAIVAGALPMAVGLALADKMKGREAVTFCFFGEGAVAEGEFHESLNLAALWKLPVAFLCENNGYAMGTALERSESVLDLYKKAESYGITSVAVDGMNVGEVEAQTSKAVEAIRAGQGPRFLEYRTYRFRAHSMFDAQLYRDKAEVEEWQKRDPITLFEDALRRRDLITAAEHDAMEARVAAEIEEAVAFAEAGTWEPVERILDDVHTEAPQ